jgi:hypothetical protein
MIKKIGFALLFILIGIITGGVSVSALYGYKLSRVMFFLQEADIVRVEEAASEAFEKESPEVGIWALEFYLDFFDEIIKQRLSSVENETDNEKDVFLITNPKDRFFNYAKLALLYDKIGNEAKRDDNLRKAAEGWGKADDEKYKEDLLECMEKMYQERNTTPPSENCVEAVDKAEEQK